MLCVYVLNYYAVAHNACEKKIVQQKNSGMEKSTYNK